MVQELEYDLKVFEREAQQRAKQLQRQAALEAAERATLLAGSPHTPAAAVPARATAAACTPSHGSSGVRGASVRGDMSGSGRGKPLTTPRLRDASTPRTSRASRTPGAAVLAALSGKRGDGVFPLPAPLQPAAAPAAAAGGGGGGGHHHRLSPVPFQIPADVQVAADRSVSAQQRQGLHVHLDPSPAGSPKRRWSVALRQKENRRSGSSSSGSSSATPEKAPKAAGLAVNSLLQLKPPQRAPAHRTPYEGKRKKKRIGGAAASN